MSNKEDFLKVKTYEEYDRRRDEFRNLDIRDPEILNHLDELYPKLEKSGWEDGIIEEVYSYLPDGQRVLGGKGDTKPSKKSDSEEPPVRNGMVVFLYPNRKENT